MLNPYRMDMWEFWTYNMVSDILTFADRVLKYNLCQLSDLSDSLWEGDHYAI